MGFGASGGGVISKSTAINGGNAASTSGSANTSTQVFASNSTALERGITNLSGNPFAVIFLGLGVTATIGNGPTVRPGDPPWVSTTFTGQVNWISSSASVPAAIYEVQVAGPYTDAILSTPGLVAHWPLSDTTGSTMVDVGPNGLNGTYTGTVTKGVTSMVVDTGTAISCAGASFATIPDHALLDVNTHTFLAWVVPTTLKTAGYLCSRFAQWGYALSRHSYGPDLGGVTPQNSSTLGELIVPEGSYFLAGGYSGSTTRLWVNGSLSSDVASSGTLATGSNPLTLGNIAGVNTFEGVAQHFSLFNRLLSDQEIKDLYLLGIRGAVDPAGFGFVVPWSRQILGSNGLRKRITNPSGTRIYLGFGKHAVDAAGPVLDPFGDVRDFGSYTGSVYAKHTLNYGHKVVVVEEY